MQRCHARGRLRAVPRERSVTAPRRAPEQTTTSTALIGTRKSCMGITNLHAVLLGAATPLRVGRDSNRRMRGLYSCLITEELHVNAYYRSGVRTSLQSLDFADAPLQRSQRAACRNCKTPVRTTGIARARRSCLFSFTRLRGVPRAGECLHTRRQACARGVMGGHWFKRPEGQQRQHHSGRTRCAVADGRPHATHVPRRRHEASPPRAHTRACGGAGRHAWAEKGCLSHDEGVDSALGLLVRALDPALVADLDLRGATRGRERVRVWARGGITRPPKLHPPLPRKPAEHRLPHPRGAGSQSPGHAPFVPPSPQPRPPPPIWPATPPPPGGRPTLQIHSLPPDTVADTSWWRPPSSPSAERVRMS